jgi:hypothetical protein
MCSEITPIVYVVVEVRPSGDGLRLDEAPQSGWAASGGGDGRPEAGTVQVAVIRSGMRARWRRRKRGSDRQHTIHGSGESCLEISFYNRKRTY